ncbi:MAG: adenylate kinase family protein [Archaeoglobaceae archaeon]|nr:adenylate kinase family protein [Archaeoglobaceae archaeon]MCX8151953.1 adenylate kinase family protein [Archaeoglobaceae archaeon]MDW8013342.1 adenylate kinase family protein [Archaeoglobaceae archaeon]
MLVAITGTPGVGKSSVAEKLKEKGYKVEKLLNLALKHNCVIGEENGELVVDVEKLSEIRFDGIVEGHLSHFLKADKVVVLRCDPLVLKDRLIKRGWSFEKVMDNVEAELLDLILVEALEKNSEVYEIDVTNMDVEEVANVIEEIIKGKGEKFKPGKIDWLSKFADRIEEVARL